MSCAAREGAFVAVRHTSTGGSAASSSVGHRSSSILDPDPPIEATLRDLESARAKRGCARLSTNLAPDRTFSLGFRGQDASYRGTVTGWSVRMSAVSGLQRNSWRSVFEGGIYSEERGTWLIGTTGPVTFVPVFSAIWFGFVSLFFVGGLVGLVVDASTGHATVAPQFVLIPLAMMAFFVVLTEFASSSAHREWVGMDLWVRKLLEVPLSPDH